jgi:molybdopterin-guanine dinucleotide biosynthesis protein A
MNSMRKMSMIGVGILAGGKSLRMGMDKGLVKLDGVALIERIARQVSGIAPEIFVITNRIDEYKQFGYPVVADAFPGIGPLGGLYTALEYDRHDHTLILSCDMPFVNQDLLLYMNDIIGEYDAVVPRLSPDAHPEPLRAIYHKRCMEHMLESIESGMRKAISFYKSINVRYVERDEIETVDPELTSFFNANTKEDLLRAGNYVGNYPLMD